MSFVYENFRFFSPKYFIFQVNSELLRNLIFSTSNYQICNHHGHCVITKGKITNSNPNHVVTPLQNTNIYVLLFLILNLNL